MRGALIQVVFPVHNGDISLALRHAQWLVQLAGGTRWKHPATIAHDPSCNKMGLDLLLEWLRQCFEKVDAFVYPQSPQPAYPAVANWSFRNAALKMREHGVPWFWLEADSAVLRREWLERFQSEYDRCGRAFMGSVVPGMGHLQGTAVYPPNTPERLPNAMSCINKAFDMVGKKAMAGDVHDCSHLMFHVWSLVREGDKRNARPSGVGDVPANITAEELTRWLPKSAVYFHRVKDSSVCEQLISGRFSQH